jgi:NCS1 family nucleobase:cation symporter-1
MAGTVNSYSGGQWTGWVRLYNLTFIVGLAMSFLIFWVLNFFFPPTGLGQEGPFMGEEVIYGVAKTSGENDAGSRDEEKKVPIARVV